MRIHVRRRRFCLYIRFQEIEVTTQHVADGIAADFDAQGRPAGIEILSAVTRLGDPTVFRRVILEDLRAMKVVGRPATQ